MGSVKHPTDPGVEKDFADLLRLFNAHKVDYCIVGAFAVGFHAISRYTKDMDLLADLVILRKALRKKLKKSS